MNRPFYRETISSSRLKSYQNLSTLIGSRHKTQKNESANRTAFEDFRKREEKSRANTHYESYVKLNKELDEKIANIRKKYL